MLFDLHLACVASVSDKPHKENETASEGEGVRQTKETCIQSKVFH